MEDVCGFACCVCLVCQYEYSTVFPVLVSAFCPFFTTYFLFSTFRYMSGFPGHARKRESLATADLLVS